MFYYDKESQSTIKIPTINDIKEFIDNLHLQSDLHHLLYNLNPLLPLQLLNRINTNRFQFYIFHSNTISNKNYNNYEIYKDLFPINSTVSIWSESDNITLINGKTCHYIKLPHFSKLYTISDYYYMYHSNYIIYKLNKSDIWYSNISVTFVEIKYKPLKYKSDHVDKDKIKSNTCDIDDNVMKDIEYVKSYEFLISPITIWKDLQLIYYKRIGNYKANPNDSFYIQSNKVHKYISNDHLNDPIYKIYYEFCTSITIFVINTINITLEIKDFSTLYQNDNNQISTSSNISNKKESNRIESFQFPFPIYLKVNELYNWNDIKTVWLYETKTSLNDKDKLYFNGQYLNQNKTLRDIGIHSYHSSYSVYLEKESNTILFDYYCALCNANVIMNRERDNSVCCTSCGSRILYKKMTPLLRCIY